MLAALKKHSENWGCTVVVKSQTCLDQSIHSIFEFNFLRKVLEKETAAFKSYEIDKKPTVAGHKLSLDSRGSIGRQ